MFVITLAPLTTLPQPSDQLLHYFAKQKISSGQLVEVILNKRMLLGVVFACDDADTMRMAIKNSPYPLKNISSVKSSAPVLSVMQLQFALWISSYYYASLGTVLQAMVRPLGIKSTSKKLPVLAAPGLSGNPGIDTPNKEGNCKAALFLEGLPEKIYRDIFSCANNKQILVLVPERKDILIYEKVIREVNPTVDIRTFHADMRTTAERAVARDAYARTPFVVIGTRSALFLPFRNLGTIIVERPSDPSHTSWDQNPHLNAPRAAVWLQQHGFASVFFHEEEPSVESLHYAHANHWDIQYSKTKKSSRGVTADMREELKKGSQSILCKNLQNILAEANKNKETIFLFVQRRGFASGIVCRDCGFVIMCPSCSVPMVYHDQGSKKFLLCHRCQTRQNAPTLCPSCKGNRIRFIGAGTERVEEEVKKMFPDLSICRIDSDAQHTDEFFANLRESLLRGTCAYHVIVGTHSAWSILPSQSVDVGSIITIDGLLSLPDYRSQERVYGSIEKMKKVTRREYIVQTYCPEAPVFSFALANDWDSFEKKECSLRKILKWPPFVQIIRMQYAHAQAALARTQAQQALRLLQMQIKDLQSFDAAQLKDNSVLAQCEILGPSPAFVDKVKNKYVWNLVLKWPVDEKCNAQHLELRNRLLAVLPRGWDIDVDPIDLV